MTNQSNTPWTTDRLAQLRELWVLGYSAYQIACRMEGVTRNAVIGALHRHVIGCQVQKNQAQKKRRPTHRNVVRRIITAKVAAKVAAKIPFTWLPQVQPPTAPVPFANLGPGECRFPLWPHGEPGTRLSLACGCPALAGESYCVVHWGVTHSPSR